MALILTRLRWALTVNGWRKSTLTLVFSVIGTLYFATLAALLVAGLVMGLPELDTATRGIVTVLVGSAVVLLWTVLPPLVTGVDATLDPSSFVLFPVPARTLVAGLLLSTFTTPVGALTLLVLLGTAASWWDTPAAFAVGAVGAVLSAVTAVALGYGVTGLLSSFTGRRRVREALSLVVLVPLMLGGVAFLQVMESIEDLFWLGPTLARAAAWSPFGSGLAVGAAAAEGAWGTVLLRLAVAAVWAVLALALWHLAIRRTVEPRAAAGSAAPARRGGRPADLRWLGRPATSARTAIAARCQHYWFADPRYLASLMIIPLLLVLFWFMSTTVGGDGLGLLLLMGPVTAWALGYSLSADIGYDHTAFHHHVLAGVRGADDRWGRVLGLFGWGLPLVVVVTVATVAADGDWALLPAMLGASLGLLGACTGLSSLVSARWVYPVPKPGDSPLKTPQGAAARTAIVQGVSLVATGVLAVPMAVPLIAFLATRASVWSWVTLVVGVAWGVLALGLGVRWGAAWYDRVQAETLQAVKAW